jgi:serine/threonine-protein kinase
LAEADLRGAKLEGADLRGTNLEGSNLRGAKVTPQQLAQAESLSRAIMPDGTEYE